MKTYLKIFSVVALILVGGAVACAVVIGGAAQQVNEELSEQHHLVYKVTSTGPGTVDYMAANRNAIEDFSGEWTKNVTVTGWDLAFVGATSNLEGGTVTCSIIERGKVLVEESATGQFAHVSCTPPLEK